MVSNPSAILLTIASGVQIGSCMSWQGVLSQLLTAERHNLHSGSDWPMMSPQNAGWVGFASECACVCGSIISSFITPKVFSRLAVLLIYCAVKKILSLVCFFAVLLHSYWVHNVFLHNYTPRFRSFVVKSNNTWKRSYCFHYFGSLLWGVPRFLVCLGVRMGLSITVNYLLIC